MQLERDVAAERAIVREVDRAHAAAAELGADLVAIVDRRALRELMLELGERRRVRVRQRALRERGDRFATALAAVDVHLELAELGRVHRPLEHREQLLIVRTRHAHVSTRHAQRSPASEKLPNV